MYFIDRSDAGRKLAERLTRLGTEAPVVLGLPRGGLPVAVEVATRLHAPLDVIVVRKLGVPFQPELGMGAIGEEGVRVVNDEVVRAAGVTPREMETVERRERAELDRRAHRYRGGRPPVRLAGRTVIVVDDGIATGSTAQAACRIARERGAARVVLAVPVAPPDWTVRLGPYADDLVALDTPANFFAVGQAYADFEQTTDEEVVDCLRRAAEARAGRADGDGPPPAPAEREVRIPSGGAVLVGDLAVPAGATGTVVFAHGSGSSRRSPRNRWVAAELNRAGLATLLFDLLTEDEALERTNVFDTALLAGRLADAVRRLADEPDVGGLPVGCFGASTGAAAALWAAAEPGTRIAAVVSRGGRPDLAGARLSEVTAPTLLVVGGWDELVLELNRRAQAQLVSCENRLEVVPGATHLFEEPGTLEAVARLARQWFTDHLAPGTSPG
ncbi:phosphoribosyltransferase family protein [Streptomyces thermolineatus]|uniref:phosphoribosyltransferase family protein n=1 Tax=Streptomyces thermolineatus TaxID=44033 RepID=UPI00384AB87D